MYIGSKNFGGNAVLLAMMIAGQAVGAFLGLFWAWLTLMDKAVMEKRDGDDPPGLVPSEWVHDICPIVGTGCDTGDGDDGFTRDF